MAMQSAVQRSFTGGELSPALAARADQTKYLSGLRTCHNMIVQRHGGVTKRPGYRFVHTAKDAAVSSRLVPFIFEAADQTYLLEFGDGVVRFYWHGAIVLDGGDPYEVESPYAGADVGRLKWTQSADILTITHPSYKPQELRRNGHTDWEFVDFETAPSIDAPDGLSGTPGAVGTLTLRYRVSASKKETFEESYASDVFVMADAAAPTGALPHNLTWTAVDDAEEYYIYGDPPNNGTFGFLGTAKTNTFNDTGFVTDYSITPPIPRELFASTDNYPSATSYAQQRLWMANSNKERETVWGSQVGAYHNYTISTPLQDDDAVTFVLAGSQLNPVAHLVSLRKLVVLTDAGEHEVLGDQNGVITPSAINPNQVGFVGAKANVRPVVVGDSLLYVQARGTVLRDLSFDDASGGVAGRDLTVYAGHLFEGYSIVDLVFASQPHSVIWAVRSDGVLLGLTYLKEQEVWGWHRHETGAHGHVERVCVLPDTTAGVDVLYLLIKRTIDGGTVRYIEKLEKPFNAIVDDLEDAFYVDSGLSYNGDPISTITGLDHLEGQRVAILADGVVISNGLSGPFTVNDGEVDLGVEASVVQAGLPIPTPDVETLDLDVEGTALRDKKKRVGSLTAIVQTSKQGFLAGPDETHLLAQRPERWRATEGLVSRLLEINLTCTFDTPGRVLIRHTDPLPFTLLGVIPNLEIGG